MVLSYGGVSSYDTMHARARSEILQMTNQGVPEYNDREWDVRSVPLIIAYEVGCTSAQSQKLRPVQRLHPTTPLWLPPRFIHVAATSVDDAGSIPTTDTANDVRYGGASPHASLNDSPNYRWLLSRSALCFPFPNPMAHPQFISTPGLAIGP